MFMLSLFLQDCPAFFYSVPRNSTCVLCAYVLVEGVRATDAHFHLLHPNQLEKVRAQSKHL